MTVTELAAALSLTPVALPDGERVINGAYMGDLLSWVMGRARADNAWITIMTNMNVIAVASLSDVACVLLAEDVMPDQAVIDTANARDINLLRSPLSSYDLAVALSDALRKASL
ncbi:MAG: hypothetical protein IJU16_02960 [Clostridia bacterium]|nr:hypothetical protein [Clostridia bacterium]